MKPTASGILNGTADNKGTSFLRNPVGKLLGLGSLGNANHDGINSDNKSENSNGSDHN